MALAPLATVADLQTRGVDVIDASRADAELAAASEAIRDAAGCPISEVTATVAIPAPSGQWLDLPAMTTAVASVEIDGEAIADYVRQGSQLWRASGWRSCGAPVSVDVTLTFGLAEVPADIVRLVCDLAEAAILTSGANPAGAVAESIDDYRVQYATGDDAAVSATEIPPRTRAWLRQRFGGGAFVVSPR